MKRTIIPLHPHRRAEQTIVVAWPLYKQIPVTWLYNWSLMDKTACAGIVSTDGVYLPQAMTAMTTMASAFNPWEWLVVMEHDMIPPVDAFNHITNYSADQDIVSGLYFLHEPPHNMVAFDYRDGHYTHLTANHTQNIIDRPKLYEVDGVGMGFTAIRRHVLAHCDWTPTPEIPGHDLSFCHQATNHGHRIWVDSRLRCGHLTETPITHTHHQIATPLA